PGPASVEGKILLPDRMRPGSVEPSETSQELTARILGRPNEHALLAGERASHGSIEHAGTRLGGPPDLPLVAVRLVQSQGESDEGRAVGQRAVSLVGCAEPVKDRPDGGFGAEAHSGAVGRAERIEELLVLHLP